MVAVLGTPCAIPLHNNNSSLCFVRLFFLPSAYIPSGFNQNYEWTVLLPFNLDAQPIVTFYISLS
jgi:hypothetical protein